MKNLSKVILSVMVTILLIALATSVYATDGIQIIGNTNVDDPINITDTNTTTTPGTTNTTDNTVGNTTGTLNIINTTNTSNNTNTSTYNNTNTTNLPQTGAGDYTMILIIGAFAVAAVYAYKRISDYKDI